MNLTSKFVLTREVGMWGAIDTLIVSLVIIGLGLHAWGIVMNAVVVIANNGIMPVVYNEPLLLIPEPGIIHQQMSNGSMLLLSDWIRIDFPDWQKHIPTGTTGAAIHWWGKFLNYPFAGGVNFVSIGDLSRWAGSLLFLIGNIFLVVCIFRRLYTRNSPHIFQ